MKKVLACFSFLIVISSHAQVHEVSGGNYGISLNGGLVMNTPKGKGFGFGAGITIGIKELVFPEISYSYQNESYGLDSSQAELSNTSNFIGLGLNNKIPIFDISLGKSNKGECWHLLLKLLFDYKYNFMLSQKSNFPFEKLNTHGFNFGLGFRPAYSGGHKSRVAWSYFYDVFYHLDFNKNDQMALQESGWKQNGIYFRLTILHYKTSDFLNNGINKKKAYKRHY